MSIRIHIFRAGTHTDSAENTRTWTEEDLDRVAETYNSHVSKNPDDDAPLAIGHIKGKSPAYGWAKSLVREGADLFAEVEPTVNEFVEWVKKKLYKKVSIAIDPATYMLKHIALLGAKAPAVKGLGAVQFELGEFEEWSIEGVWEYGRNERREKTDSSLRFGMTDKTDEEEEMDKEALSKTQDRFEELEDKVKTLTTQLSQYSESNKAKDSEVQTLKNELAETRKNLRLAEYEAFCEELAAEGKLLPAQRDLVIEFMEISNGVGEYEFSEPTEADPAKRVKKPVLEVFKGFLKSLPKQIEFEEIAKKGKERKADSEEIEVVKQIASAAPMEASK